MTDHEIGPREERRPHSSSNSEKEHTKRCDELAQQPYSPLGRGFLTGTVTIDRLTGDDLRLGDPRSNGNAGARNRLLVDQLQQVAREWDATAAHLALAWLLAQGDDVVPIPGTTRIDRLQENRAAVDLTLSAADIDRLERLAPRRAWAGDRVAFAGRQLARGRVPTNGALR